jgi:hypothetical protein
MAGRGGARPWVGRPAGQPNRATRELKASAQQYTDEAITALAEVMRDKTATANARVRAADALHDCGHGRPTQHIEAKIRPLEELSDDELVAGIGALRGC